MNHDRRDEKRDRFGSSASDHCAAHQSFKVRMMLLERALTPTAAPSGRGLGVCSTHTISVVYQATESCTGSDNTPLRPLPAHTLISQCCAVESVCLMFCGPRQQLHLVLVLCKDVTVH